MAESDARHSGDGPSGRPRGEGRRLRRVTSGIVLVVLALAGAAYGLDAGDRLGIRPDPRVEPAEVAPPAGLDLPEARTAPAVAPSVRPGRLFDREVRRAVADLPQDGRLGRRVAVLVSDLDGRQAFRTGPAVVTPASTMKLMTALAALETLGPERRFTTEVTLRGNRLTLVGGGDPLLARAQPDGETAVEIADLRTLANRTARALRAQDVRRVRLGYDVSLFTGPEVDPEWEASYVPDNVVSPIVPLWVEQGREEPGSGIRVDDPAAAAAQVFAAQLERLGVAVRGQVRSRVTPDAARRVAGVDSAELVEIVQHVLETSDNEATEVLARHVALAEGEPGSSEGAGRATLAVLERLGVPTRGAVLDDASGLARSNRLRPESIVGALVAAADPARPQLAGVLQGLPVAGFSGSLTYRFADDAEAGLGRVRAKTGTLTGVHSLAGVVVGEDGAVMAYFAGADRVKVENTLAARDLLDEISAALAACSCAARG
jgi:serine-type D-Ala-D-Ala carboxypeptidase/endopeptidase (penicillin-binding protein 4)